MGLGALLSDHVGFVVVFPTWCVCVCFGCVCFGGLSDALLGKGFGKVPPHPS